MYSLSSLLHFGKPGQESVYGALAETIESVG